MDIEASSWRVCKGVEFCGVSIAAAACRLEIVVDDLADEVSEECKFAREDINLALGHLWASIAEVRELQPHLEHVTKVHSSVQPRPVSTPGFQALPSGLQADILARARQSDVDRQLRVVCRAWDAHATAALRATTTLQICSPRERPGLLEFPYLAHLEELTVVHWEGDGGAFRGRVLRDPACFPLPRLTALDVKFCASRKLAPLCAALAQQTQVTKLSLLVAALPGDAPERGAAGAARQLPPLPHLRHLALCAACCEAPLGVGLLPGVDALSTLTALTFLDFSVSTGSTVSADAVVRVCDALGSMPHLAEAHLQGVGTLHTVPTARVPRRVGSRARAPATVAPPPLRSSWQALAGSLLLPRALTRLHLSDFWAEPPSGGPPATQSPYDGTGTGPWDTLMSMLRKLTTLRSLQLDGSNSTQPAEHKVWEGASSNLAATVGWMTQLTCLEIDGMGTHLLAEHCFSFFGRLATLQRLVLWELHMLPADGRAMLAPERDLAALLPRMPLLTDLCLRIITLHGEAAVQVAHALRALPRLERLLVHNVNPVTFAVLVAGHRVCGHLPRLCFTDLGSGVDARGGALDSAPARAPPLTF